MQKIEKESQNYMILIYSMKVFRRMNKVQLAEMGLDYNASYTDFGVTDYNEAPWG